MKAAGIPHVVRACMGMGMVMGMLLIACPGCDDDASKPDALACSVSATPITGVAPAEIAFEAEASAGKPPYGFFWEFGDGATSQLQDPTHTFETAGSYAVAMTVTDAAGATCQSEIAIQIEAGALACSASADVTSGLPPLQVQFTGSASGGQAPFSYAWEFGDGATSQQQNPTHEFQTEGLYEVHLTVQDAQESCESSIEIVVQAAPFACQAQADPAGGTVPLEVAFSAEITGGVAPFGYAWEFGDGATSQLQNPTHEYAFAGFYDATLTVTDALSQCQCGVSIEVQEVTFSCGTAAFPTSGPAPLVVSFTAEATGGTAPYTFLWNFGDGGSDQAQNPVHTFTAAGTYEVHMMVWDAESRTCQSAVSIEVQ
jgi:PKD repeat protein